MRMTPEQVANKLWDSWKPMPKNQQRPSSKPVIPSIATDSDTSTVTRNLQRIATKHGVAEIKRRMRSANIPERRWSHWLAEGIGKRRGKYIMEFCRILGVPTVNDLLDEDFEVPEMLPDFDEIKPIPASDLDPHDMLDDLLAHKHFRGEIMDKLRKLHAAI